MFDQNNCNIFFLLALIFLMIVLQHMWMHWSK